MTKIVAEIACNHMGDFQLASAMIEAVAKISGIHYVKFQKRNNWELLGPELYNSPHPRPENSFGDTYGLHREHLEFSIEEHRELYTLCAAEGIKYSCSAWDLTSAKELSGLDLDYIKIPSACNNNFQLMGWLAENFPRSLHISLGMLDRQEIDELVTFLYTRSALARTVLYACTTAYPAPENELSLLEIPWLKEKYGSRLEAIGFSGHHTSVAPDAAAIALGAQWIERHFTLNKNFKGTDHKASLDLVDLELLATSVTQVNQALHCKNEKILQKERTHRARLSGAPPIA